MNDINLSPVNDLSSRTFDNLFSRFQKLDTECLLVYLFDRVEETALVHLAEQFHITGNEGWASCTTTEEKRELIKNAINLHKYKGTKYSLERVLKILGIEGKIYEWFEYGGNPYYFKANLTSFNFTADNALLNKLISLVNEYKNVRSRLESIQLNIASKTENKVNTAIGLIENRYSNYYCLNRNI